LIGSSCLIGAADAIQVKGFGLKAYSSPAILQCTQNAKGSVYRPGHVKSAIHSLFLQFSDSKGIHSNRRFLRGGVLVRAWPPFFLLGQKTLGTLGKHSSQLVARIPQRFSTETTPTRRASLAIAAVVGRDATEPAVGVGAGVKRRNCEAEVRDPPGRIRGRLRPRTFPAHDIVALDHRGDSHGLVVVV